MLTIRIIDKSYHDGFIHYYSPTTTSLDLGRLTVKDIEEGVALSL